LGGGNLGGQFWPVWGLARSGESGKVGSPHGVCRVCPDWPKVGHARIWGARVPVWPSSRGVPKWGVSSWSQVSRTVHEFTTFHFPVLEDPCPMWGTHATWAHSSGKVGSCAVGVFPKVPSFEKVGVSFVLWRESSPLAGGVGHHQKTGVSVRCAIFGIKCGKWYLGKCPSPAMWIMARC